MAGLSLAGPAVAAPAVAAPTEPTEPPGPTREGPARAEPPALGASSEQGSRRGGLELGLGVVLAGAGVGLVAFGAVQLVRARDHVEFCRDWAASGGSSGGIDPCVFDPPPLGFVSAGLSWGFAIPLLVGSGMLFARGHRVRADARAFERLALAPWWQRSGGGVRLRLEF